MFRQNHLSPHLIKTNQLSEFSTSTYGISGTFQQLQGGVESAAWLLTSPSGQYVMKVFAPHEGPIERVKEEAHLYDFLIKHGIHAPTLIENLSGEKVSVLTTKLHKYPTLLMAYESISQANAETITQQEVESIAQTIARMHLALQTYPKASQVKGKNDREIKIWHTFPTLIASKNKEIFSSAELLHIQAVDTKMANFLAQFSTPDTDQHSIIHADLSLGHAQFLPNGEVYFFDFADRTFAPVTQELATFIMDFYRASTISFERWEELRQWTLDAYQSINRLSEKDIYAITPLLIRRIFIETDYLNHISKNLNREVDSKGNKRRYQLVEYILNQLDKKF